jgi:hypothetical protein
MMQPTIMITNGDENGGVHPREKWAAVSTAAIMRLFGVAPGTDEVKLSELRAFEAAVLTICTDHHGRVKEFTRQCILDHGKDGFELSSSSDPLVDEPLLEIVRAAKPYSFAGGIASVAAMDRIRGILRTSIEIEHEWHCHRVHGSVHAEHAEKFGDIVNPPAVRHRHRRKLAAQAEG